MLANRFASRLISLLCCCILWTSSPVAAATFASRPEVQRFIAEVSAKHNLDSAWLEGLFERVTPRPVVAQTMTRQVVKPRTWVQFRADFISPWRIAQGVHFWRDNSTALARARQTYGVPEEIVVAIIGVETRYGAYPLRYPVLDTLATLAFDYPRRADFYRNELEQYLLLMHEENMDPLAIKGSFAGAMGLPQFMPSSYRTYGVDFDGDGRRDLLNDPTDAIGSVGNYLKGYGWEAGQPVATRAFVQPDAAADLLSGNLKPEHTVQELIERGIAPSESLNARALAALHAVDTEDGREYWLGLNNFYVITRYNRSLFYALVVHQLANEIRDARLRGR